jgi:hypothetical protein
VSLPPISLGDNKTKRSTDPSQDGVNQKNAVELGNSRRGSRGPGGYTFGHHRGGNYQNYSQGFAASTINNSPDDVAAANDLIEGVSQLAQPVASSTIPPANPYESTWQISESSQDKRGNLKIDEDYEQGDPWDNFSFGEINGQYFAVAVGKKFPGLLGPAKSFCDSCQWLTSNGFTPKLCGHDGSTTNICLDLIFVFCLVDHCHCRSMNLLLGFGPTKCLEWSVFVLYLAWYARFKRSHFIPHVSHHPMFLR